MAVWPPETSTRGKREVPYCINYARPLSRLPASYCILLHCYSLEYTATL